MIRQGGLMRCCIETIMLAAHGGTLDEAQPLQCRYIDAVEHRMRYRDGAWEWDWPDTQPEPSRTQETG